MIKTNNNDIYNMITSSIFISYVYSPWNSQNQISPRQTQQAKSALNMLPNIMPTRMSCPSKTTARFSPVRLLVRPYTHYLHIANHSELSQFRQSAKTSTIVLLFPLSPRISPHELLGAWRLTRSTCLYLSLPQSIDRSKSSR